MAQFKKTEIQLDHQIDQVSWRHYLNGQLSVLHCHHYAALYTQLADDCKLLDGKQLLIECSEDAFLEALSLCFAGQGIDAITDRIAIAEQLYAAYGLGRMHVVCAGPESGQVELDHSHVDRRLDQEVEQARCAGQLHRLWLHRRPLRRRLRQAGPHLPRFRSAKHRQWRPVLEVQCRLQLSAPPRKGEQIMIDRRKIIETDGTSGSGRRR